ncbi:MAG TPA: OmpA family protein [Stellaceae bacterium]|nr:OmpA family protein [Stellaceae bacterium]
MSMRCSAAASAAFVIAAALSMASAQAQTFYIGAEGGWTDLETKKDRLPPTIGPAHTHWDSGFNVGARGGLQWGNWRLEEEYNYRRNDLNNLTVGGATIPGGNGHREAHAIMTNAIYDFNFGWPVTPHLGAGAGAVDIVDTLNLPGIRTHSDDWEFGYQGIAGLRYMATPNIALDLDYRYLATTDGTFSLPGGGHYHSGYRSHNVLASLTYVFAAPPPPPVAVPPAPPPPPPPAERRVFLVFFDWDKATITPAGMQVIQQAADAYRQGHPVQIQVTGYTDRSGSPGYNQRLSERRANNVAEAMTRMGVPRDQMAVSGRGENDNRVPTADGVREPQNRRVEIVFP